MLFGLALFVTGFLLGYSAEAASPAAANRGLFFRGTSNSVEIVHPPLARLKEITVEGWVVWNRFRDHSRVFELGRSRHCFTLVNAGGRPDLLFEIWDGRDGVGSILIPGLLRSNQWCHVAAVLSSQGMRLYFNGFLVGSNGFKTSVEALGLKNSGYLGKSVWDRPDHRSFDGAVDEVRVWDHDRSASQVAEGMGKRLSGKEAGLVALWNFDTDSGLTDVSGHRLDLLNPRGVQTRELVLPEPSQLTLPALVRVRVRDAESAPIERAIVQMFAVEGPLTETKLSEFGHGRGVQRGVYLLNCPNPEQTFGLRALSERGTVEATGLRAQAGRISEFDLTYSTGPSLQSTNEFARWLGRELRDPQRGVRRTAMIQRLFELGPRAAEAGPDLMMLLRDPDPDIRQRAFEALSSIKKFSTAQIGMLLELLDSRDQDARARAHRLLTGVDVPDNLEPYFMKTSQAVSYLVAGLLASFALLHCVLFIFYPTAVSNLHYSLFCGTGAASALLADYVYRPSETSLRLAATFFYFSTLILALRLLYSIFDHKLDRRFWIFCAYWPVFFVASILFSFLDTDGGRIVATVLFYWMLLLSMYRVLTRQRAREYSGAWIGGAGLGFLLACLTLSFFRGPFPVLREALGIALTDNLPHVRLTGFVIANSIYLARQFGRTNRELQLAKDALETQRSHLAFAKDAAEEASHAKSAFLANMSHELRAPLNAIIGYSEMLHEDASDSSQKGIQADLQKITGAGRHLLGLINDVLDLSKIEAGRLSVTVDTVDLGPLLQEVVGTLQPLADKNRNLVVMDIPRDLGACRSDDIRLRQILLNLLSNAAKFTEGGGSA